MKMIVIYNESYIVLMLRIATYTNTENRPRLIQEQKNVKKIALSHKTGLPLGALKPRTRTEEIERGDEEMSETDTVIYCGTQTRPKNETAEEKKRRKAETKQQRRVRYYSIFNIILIETIRLVSYVRK
jgi:protein LTV1